MTETTKSKLETLRGIIVMLFGAATIGFLIWAMGIPAAQRLGWIEVESNHKVAHSNEEYQQQSREMLSRIYDDETVERIMSERSEGAAK